MSDNLFAIQEGAMDAKRLEALFKQTAKDYDMTPETIERVYNRVGHDGLYDELESWLGEREVENSPGQRPAGRLFPRGSAQRESARLYAPLPQNRGRRLLWPPMGERGRVR